MKEDYAYNILVIAKWEIILHNTAWIPKYANLAKRKALKPQARILFDFIFVHPSLLHQVKVPGNDKRSTWSNDSSF